MAFQSNLNAVIVDKAPTKSAKIETKIRQIKGGGKQKAAPLSDDWGKSFHRVLL